MRGFLCGLVLIACGSSSLLAADEQRFRAQLGYVSSATELFQPNGVSLGAQSALGFRLSFEYLFTERFGLEAGLATSQHELTLFIVNGVPRNSEYRLTPLTLAANLHFGDSDRVDTFFGGGLAYVTVGEYLPAGRSEEVSVDAELTWMAQFGMDIALGRRPLFDPLEKNWSLGLSVSLMEGDAPAGDQTIPLEAISIYAGITWHRR